MLTAKHHSEINARMAVSKSERYEAKKPLRILLEEDKPNLFLRFLAVMTAIAGTVGLVIVASI